MCDDLANDWGCNYCYPEERRGTISPCDVTEFRQAISSSTQGKFVLLKLMGCGSDANLWAISDATCFNALPVYSPQVRIFPVMGAPCSPSDRASSQCKIS